MTRGAFGRDHSGASERGERSHSDFAGRSFGATPKQRDGRMAIEELRRNFDYRFQKQRDGERKLPDPKIVEPLRRSTEGMRRVVATPACDAAAAGPCPYRVGERVEHPKFGAGVITRIENLTTDHKVVVDFGQYGEKTLLAKFAKLTKL